MRRKHHITTLKVNTAIYVAIYNFVNEEEKSCLMSISCFQFLKKTNTEFRRTTIYHDISGKHILKIYHDINIMLSSPPALPGAEEKSVKT